MANATLIVIALLLIGGYFLLATDLGKDLIDNIQGKTKTITCNIVVINPIFGDDFKIKGSPSCLSSNTLSVTKPLSIFGSNEVRVSLVVSGKTLASESVKLGDFVGREKTITLFAKVSEEVTNGVIQIRNDENRLTDSKSVSF